MTATIEALLADLTKEVKSNTETSIRLEITTTSKLEELRKDYIELRDILSSITLLQASFSERLTANETRVGDLQNVREEISDIRATVRGLEAHIEATAPVRTPWTAIMSSVVALGALLYALFGK